jgi:hypothetical protein
VSEQKNAPAATFRYKLRADSGYSAEGEARITPEQYGDIMAIIHGATISEPSSAPTGEPIQESKE